MTSTQTADGDSPGGAAQPPRARRGGRRPGDSTTREEILRAARRHFAQYGYTGTSVRAVAAEAGVNQALIYHFFGSKERLFGACLPTSLPHLPVEDALDALQAALRQGGPPAAALAITRLTFELWEDDTTGDGLRAMVRSSLPTDPASEHLRAWLQSGLISRVAEAIGADAVPERVALVTAHLFGVAVARYVVEVPPLVRLSLDDLVAWVAPVVHRYLTEPLPGAAAAAADPS